MQKWFPKVYWTIDEETQVDDYTLQIRGFFSPLDNEIILFTGFIGDRKTMFYVLLHEMMHWSTSVIFPVTEAWWILNRKLDKLCHFLQKIYLYSFKS